MSPTTRLVGRVASNPKVRRAVAKRVARRVARRRAERRAVVGRVALRAGSGALAGAAATAPMSAVMVVARRSGLMRRAHPPEEIVEGAAHAVDEQPERGTKRALAVVSHFAFGAGAGVLFALAARGSRRAVLVEGMAYGATVWLVSYRGWLPRVGLMPHADDDEEGRQVAMVAAHVVYGAALGALTPTR